MDPLMVQPPQVSAAEMQYGLGGTSAPSPAAAPQQDADPALVRWLSDKKRVESYELAFPFEIDGVEYRTVTLRRLTAREVEVFMARMRDAGSAERLHWPLYRAGDAELPGAAWDAMDDDDRFALSELAEGYFPARFRLATAGS